MLETKRTTKFFIFIFLWLYVYFFTACASKEAKISVDKQPSFSNSRQYEQKPEAIRQAAQRVLEELISASNPATNSSVTIDNDAVSTGWVYSTSKDKFVLITYNNIPKRVALQVRRKYNYSISSSLAGTTVVVTAEEEIQPKDLKTGEGLSWKPMETDNSVYQLLLQKLTDKLRSL